MEKSTVKIRTCAANEIMRGAWPLVVLDLQEVCSLLQQGIGPSEHVDSSDFGDSTHMIAWSVCNIMVRS